MTKYGYTFDANRHAVRKLRKARRCEGGWAPGRTLRHAADCTGTIERGDLACASTVYLYEIEHYACLPCALAIGAVATDLTNPGPDG